MDPSEFIENRTELSLSGLGLEVVQAGVDWGESQVELQLARQQIGESATNRHLTNVSMTIPLRVQKESGVKLAEAAYALQQKVGLWQAEGGWIRRDFDVDGKFAGSVGYQIIGASLSGLQGWMFAHRQTAPEVSLKLIRSPLCYSATEGEVASSEVEGNELIRTWENMPGTSPGLVRRKVTNKNASAHWRSVIAAMENRDYPVTGAESTAKLAYAAKELTRKGGSTEAERGGVKVVRNTALTAGWLSVLGTEISGTGHMTHAGVRRLWARVFVEGGAVGNVELKLLWRPLGTLTWSENEAVVVPLVGGYQLIDLGEVRCEPPIVGEPRWEGQFQARATTGSGNIDIQRIYPLPTEQFAVYTAPGSTAQPELQSIKSPGTVEDKSGVGTIEWKTPAEAKTSNNVYATASLVIGGQVSHYLKATNFGFALPESASVAGIIASVERSIVRESGEVITTQDYAVNIVKGGTIMEAVNKASGAAWPTVDSIATYGGSADLWGQAWLPSDINSSTFGVAIAAQQIVGFALARVDAISLTVYYTEAADENRVCFANRSIEFRSDGAARQHPTANVWGRVIPEAGGFNLNAPVAGLEKRKARGIIIPSQGDLGEIADASSGVNKMAEQDFYRAGYLFARESA